MAEPTRRAIAPPELQAGYFAVPLLPEAQGSPLQLCVMVRREAEPIGGHFIGLRQTPDARAFLGCLTDAAGKPLRWLEVWVQDFPNVKSTFPSVAGALSNAVLDQRWRTHLKAIGGSGAKYLAVTGWEEEHPAPIWINLKEMAA